MAYKPFQPCPPDTENVAEALPQRGFQPLPRRRCFSRTPSKVPPISSLPGTANPFPASLPDSAVLWPPSASCKIRAQLLHFHSQLAAATKPFGKKARNELQLVPLPRMTRALARGMVFFGFLYSNLEEEQRENMAAAMVLQRSTSIREAPLLGLSLSWFLPAIAASGQLQEIVPSHLEYDSVVLSHVRHYRGSHEESSSRFEHPTTPTNWGIRIVPEKKAFVVEKICQVQSLPPSPVPT